jgi:hypothetical protein
VARLGFDLVDALDREAACASSASAAATGTIPARTRALVAASSTRSQFSNFRCSDQIAAMAGRV